MAIPKHIYEIAAQAVGGVGRDAAWHRVFVVIQYSCMDVIHYSCMDARALA